MVIKHSIPLTDDKPIQKCPKAGTMHLGCGICNPINFSTDDKPEEV